MTSSATTCKRFTVDRSQLLVLLAAAVMVGSFFLLVLWPKQRELSALKTIILRERDLVSQKMRASHEGIYVSARIGSLRKIQDRLDRQLPDDPQLAEFMHDVGECVRAESGVSQEIQRAEADAVSTTETLERVRAIPVRLRLTGPFDKVYRCLAQIEKLERMNQVSRVHFERLDDSGKVAAEALILVYYLLPEGSAASDGASQAESQPKAVCG